MINQRKFVQLTVLHSTREIVSSTIIIPITFVIFSDIIIKFMQIYKEAICLFGKV